MFSIEKQGIARKGKYGSFLLPDYDRVEDIAKALGSSDVPIPFSVKIRLLPSLDDTIKLCKMLEREGAQLITVQFSFYILYNRYMVEHVNKIKIKLVPVIGMLFVK